MSDVFRVLTNALFNVYFIKNIINQSIFLQEKGGKQLWQK